MKKLISPFFIILFCLITLTSKAQTSINTDTKDIIKSGKHLEEYGKKQYITKS